jgi:hypothetical protein
LSLLSGGPDCSFHLSILILHLFCLIKLSLGFIDAYSTNQDCITVFADGWLQFSSDDIVGCVELGLGSLSSSGPLDDWQAVTTPPDQTVSGSLWRRLTGPPAIMELRLRAEVLRGDTGESSPQRNDETSSAANKESACNRGWGPASRSTSGSQSNLSGSQILKAAEIPRAEMLPSEYGTPGPRQLSTVESLTPVVAVANLGSSPRPRPTPAYAPTKRDRRHYPA